MGDTTGIAWARSTFNPWMGCQRISRACDSCYAESFVSNRMGYREDGARGFSLWGPKGQRKVTSDANWCKPVQWNADAAKSGEFWPVFCASLADVFEDRRDLDEPRARLFALIEATPALAWLLLTKRADRILSLAPERWSTAFPPNVWMGCTAENQAMLDARVKYLALVPARVRFLSIEPQLEAVDVSEAIKRGVTWLITGGESGPNARPYDPDWARSIIRQCEGTPAFPFVKQMGEAWAKSTETRAKSAHGSDPDLWPDDVRVQGWPVPQ